MSKDQNPKTQTATPATTATAEHTDPARKVLWNVQNLKSSYVNFANANSTQEEVVLNFGMNNNWDRQAAEVQIDLTHRVVMSPFAAKRLAELLTRLVDQYEARYGALR